MGFEPRRVDACDFRRDQFVVARVDRANVSEDRHVHNGDAGAGQTTDLRLEGDKGPIVGLVQIRATGNPQPQPRGRRGRLPG